MRLGWPWLNDSEAADSTERATVRSSAACGSRQSRQATADEGSGGTAAVVQGRRGTSRQSEPLNHCLLELSEQHTNTADHANCLSFGSGGGSLDGAAEKQKAYPKWKGFYDQNDKKINI
jgi:hypothetical protein